MSNCKCCFLLHLRAFPQRFLVVETYWELFAQALYKMKDFSISMKAPALSCLSCITASKQEWGNPVTSNLKSVTSPTSVCSCDNVCAFCQSTLLVLNFLFCCFAIEQKSLSYDTLLTILMYSCNLVPCVWMKDLAWGALQHRKLLEWKLENFGQWIRRWDCCKWQRNNFFVKIMQSTSFKDEVWYLPHPWVQEATNLGSAFS